MTGHKNYLDKWKNSFMLNRETQKKMQKKNKRKMKIIKVYKIIGILMMELKILIIPSLNLYITLIKSQISSITY